ncbi:uncharacterized protein LOC141837125 [Curcuma longa]|uniref:uncharacterized protein LOC141837125 n=1 Tax=Curcuma longa TaxID=136217 RepID=UPI003D9E78A1
MQEVAGERGGYLHGRGALDSDDLLYLKEQMEAEEDAEQLLRRTEKQAFGAFKISSLDEIGIIDILFFLFPCYRFFVPIILKLNYSFSDGRAAGYLEKKYIQVKPKKQEVSSPSLLQFEHSNQSSPGRVSPVDSEVKLEISLSPSRTSEAQKNSCLDVNNLQQQKQEQALDVKPENTVKSLLGLAYESSDEK